MSAFDRRPPGAFGTRAAARGSGWMGGAEAGKPDAVAVAPSTSGTGAAWSAVTQSAPNQNYNNDYNAYSNDNPADIAMVVTVVGDAPALLSGSPGWTPTFDRGRPPLYLPGIQWPASGNQQQEPAARYPTAESAINACVVALERRGCAFEDRQATWSWVQSFAYQHDDGSWSLNGCGCPTSAPSSIVPVQETTPEPQGPLTEEEQSTWETCAEIISEAQSGQFSGCNCLQFEDCGMLPGRLAEKLQRAFMRYCPPASLTGPDGGYPC